VLVWVVLPAEWAGLAWCLLGALLFEAGVLRLPEQLKPFASGLALFGALRVFTHTPDHDLAASAILYYLGWRNHGSALMRVHLGAASLLATIAVLRHVDAPYHTPVLAAFAFVLLAAGNSLRVFDLRVHAYIVSVVATVTALVHLDAWIPAAAAVSVLYGCEFFARRVPEPERRVRALFAILATLLVSTVLHHHVSGSLLTVAVGMQGLALLLAGFPARERVLRLFGLGLLLACILKLFVYDLRHLETLYRILSFITLGVILLSVSWVYARFRERLKQFL
jgi:hypothetical protein